MDVEDIILDLNLEVVDEYVEIDIHDLILKVVDIHDLSLPVMMQNP